MASSSWACGKNNLLEPDEKLAILKAAVAVLDRRVPIVVGVPELTTPRACRFAGQAAELGADALMRCAVGRSGAGRTQRRSQHRA